MSRPFLGIMLLALAGPAAGQDAAAWRKQIEVRGALVPQTVDDAAFESFEATVKGAVANVVPAANIQQVPFAFRSAEQAHKTVDGPLGTYLRGEMAAKGIVGFQVGAFDNGMRQIAGRTRPVRTPADLAGLKMRVPDGQMFDDMARALGAEPVTVNSADIYSALQKGTVDAQENPYAIIHASKFDEVQ